MVLAYHLTISAYGFWLPNDERGSWSDFVRRYELLQFGDATKIETHRSVAHHSHDIEQRMAAKAALMYPPVVFTGIQARCIIKGFRYRIERSGIPVYACVIMPDHAHLVLGRFRYKVEQMTNLLKGAATQQLTRDGLHPLSAFRTKQGGLPSPWSVGYWAVYLDSHEDVARSIRYDENNPVRAGLPAQKWSFVRAYPDDSGRGASGEPGPSGPR